jgi:hypothetical protein
MRLCTVVLVLLAGIIPGSPAACAAEVGCLLEGRLPGEPPNLFIKRSGRDVPLKGQCIMTQLSGPIIAGDYEKVRKLIQNGWPEMLMINLHSLGGSVIEGMKIGRMLRKYLIAAEVSPAGCDSNECDCASACALIWFGAVQRMGRVGLHRPRIGDPDFANSPPEEATRQYRRVLSEIENYLIEMEVPRPIVDTMLATSSSEIHWVDAVTEGLSRPPSYAEWEDASCHDKFDAALAIWATCQGLLRSSSIENLSPP